jgi:hypothetical protein
MYQKFLSKTMRKTNRETNTSSPGTGPRSGRGNAAGVELPAVDVINPLDDAVKAGDVVQGGGEAVQHAKFLSFADFNKFTGGGDLDGGTLVPAVAVSIAAGAVGHDTSASVRIPAAGARRCDACPRNCPFHALLDLVQVSPLLSP